MVQDLTKSYPETLENISIHLLYYVLYTMLSNRFHKFTYLLFSASSYSTCRSPDKCPSPVTCPRTFSQTRTGLTSAMAAAVAETLIRDRSWGTHTVQRTHSQIPFGGHILAI